MTMNNQGRPTAAGRRAEANELPTISGDRGLDHEEPLIFELGRDGVTGVDLPDVQMSRRRGWAACAARGRSACRASASRKSCAIMCGCRG